MRRIRRKRKSNRTVLYLLLAVILFIGIAVFCKSNVFNISTISVEGTETLNISDIIELSGLKVGTNIFDFRASSVENLFSTESLVKSAEIKRIYPDEVRIIIKERTPYITVSAEATYYYLDEDGMVIYTSSLLNRDCGIILSGATDVSLNKGEFFNYNSNVNTMTAFNIADILKQTNVYDFVSEIYVSQSGYYYLYTEKSNVIKFYSLSSFESNKDFIADFILNEDRHIMIEVIEDSEPVYKVIDIK